MAGKLDQYANIASVKVTESAANTQTSTKFAFPFSIMDKMALLISRVEYWLGTPSNMNSDQDYVYMAVTAAATIVDLSNQSDPLVLDSVAQLRQDWGAAASGILVQNPIVKDFANLPGGGILVAPNPLYAMVKGSNNGAANVLWVKLFYTYLELKTDEYWQLVESRRVISG